MGFRHDITRIISYLPKERQTLLFSATLPKELSKMTELAMRKDYSYINTIEEGEENTNVQVTQEYIVTPLCDQIASLENILKCHQKERAATGYKIMVFFNTARTTGYLSRVFQHAEYNVLEMHSRKSQGFRTKTAKSFTEQKNVIMFSSDVSARGVDYPGVTLIVQVGLTSKEQYIHRLGRTGRAGKEGKGILLLSEFEKTFLTELHDLKITKLENFDMTASTETQTVLDYVVKSPSLLKEAGLAYQAFLGFYNGESKKLGMSKQTLIEIANEYSTILGCVEQPSIGANIVGKMGLKGQSGLRITKGKSSPRNIHK